MNPETAISVRNLTKAYKLYDTPQDRFKEALHPLRRKYHHDYYALKDVSFEVRRGETVGIVGKNGSGKSTLLKLVTGVLTPTSGSLTVNGKISALLELGAGFNPELTGLENVYFNGTLMGYTREQMDRKLDDILAFADIGEYIHQTVKMYSSGMFVRLAFAVSAHADADILIIDEALAVGDAFFVQKCMRYLRRFMEQGTVLLVSHDTAAVLNLCRTAVWLHKGGVEAIGAPKEVTERYLENIYEVQQGEGVGRRGEAPPRAEPPPAPPRDMRADFVNRTGLRNDIELLAFSPDGPGFGKGGVDIVDVNMLDGQGRALSWVVGGEGVQLVVDCANRQALDRPIVGFMVKDRLGQTVFADSTYITYARRPPSIPPGSRFRAVFGFSMPVMPVGNYTVSVAVAEGTDEQHVQHRWLHEALAFAVHSSRVCYGLVGIPMTRIELTVLPD